MYLSDLSFRLAPESSPRALIGHVSVTVDGRYHLRGVALWGDVDGNVSVVLPSPATGKATPVNRAVRPHERWRFEHLLLAALRERGVDLRGEIGLPVYSAPGHTAHTLPISGAKQPHQATDRSVTP